LTHYSAKPIHLALRPSRFFTGVLLTVALFSLVMLWLLQLPFLFKWMLAAGVVICAAYYIQRDALLLLLRSPARLDLIERQFQLTLQDETVWPVMVLDSSFISPYLSVLHLKVVDERRRLCVILLPDNVDPSAFRQLRVWLRWGKTNDLETIENP
jgi:toxin CptA